MDKFQDIFEVVDLVFYHLHILEPASGDMEETKKSISVLKYLWKYFGLKRGPKLHILFDHTMKQV